MGEQGQLGRGGKASLKRSWCKRSSSWCRTYPWKYTGALQGQGEPRHPTYSTSPHCPSPQACWVWAEAAETTPYLWPGRHWGTAWRRMLSWQPQGHPKNIHKSLFAKAFICIWWFGPQIARCVVYSTVLSKPFPWRQLRAGSVLGKEQHLSLRLAAWRRP